MILLREATVAATDGRTLSLDLLGFDVEYPIDKGDRPDLGPYAELWEPGAFRHQERAPHRIDLVYRHREHVKIGRGMGLRETAGRLLADFRVTMDPPEMIAEWIADGYAPSVGFDTRPASERIVRRPGRRPLVRYSHGTVAHAGMTPLPAYPDTRALALREGTPASPAPGGRAAAWRVWLDLQRMR